MNSWIIKHRFIIARRIVQIVLLILFAGSNWFGWKILMGNYSSAWVLEMFYLSDPHAVVQTLATGFIVGYDVLIGAAIVLGFYAIIGGRSFCSWVCPVNIVTGTANWLRRKIEMPKSNFVQLMTRKTRYWILLLGLIISALSGVAAFELINPVTMLHRGIIFGFGMGWALIVMIFLFDLLIIEYGWCGYLCPLGAFYSIISKYSLIKIGHLQENCTKCMKCKDVCPEKQVLKIIGLESGIISSGECTNCGRCIEICNDNSLKYTLNNYKKQEVL
ncbi:MAG: quinol dehydrogenase ferredoxin subunit NapH [Bacteroidales bacterium]|nr:quinol dehydrogenase ferredoxin subunit NapH [Bacteroidales bacterium]